MTWLELYADLCELADELKNGEMASWGDLSPFLALADEGFVRLEERHEKKVDSAARAFARGRAIPTLEAMPRFLLWLRVHYAQKQCLSLAGAVALGILGQAKGSREEALRWLLFDCWERIGFEAIHDTIESLLLAWPNDSDPGMN